MTRLITIIMFTLTVLSLTAQTEDKAIFVGKIISDPTTLKDNRYRAALPSILKSKNKIEIRLITSSSFDYTSYTVLTFDKKWSAKYFYYEPGADSLLSRDINKKVNLDTLFSRLVTNNIFSLPDQSSLKPEKDSYNPETDEFIGSGMDIGHGTSYYIEFKVSDFYRRYRYYEPESYADFYSLVYELRSFANIVSIFSELTKE